VFLGFAPALAVQVAYKRSRCGCLLAGGEGKQQYRLLLNRLWKANTGASVTVGRPTCQCHRTVRCLRCVGSLSGPTRSGSLVINSRQAPALTRLQRPNGIPLISY